MEITRSEESQPKEFKKVVFADYEGKYDESMNERLATSPDSIDIESMRAYLYGYTFTEGYANGKFPDEMSMDYWPTVNEIISDSFDEIDDYLVDSPQEKLLLQAIDSTGDGKSAETALCVIDTGQEYEYLRRVIPYSFLEVERQSLLDGIDRLDFADNGFDIKCIYFDVHRRFEVGYPKFNL